MSKRFRVCSLDQEFLLPPSLQDWLPEDHLARFIADVANELDLSAIYAEYERRDGRGLSAYHPLLMTRLLLDDKPGRPGDRQNVPPYGHNWGSSCQSPLLLPAARFTRVFARRGR
jgi:hypothetical protein